jgi:P27 family predicted phage terminase small subunit
MNLRGWCSYPSTSHAYVFYNFKKEGYLKKYHTMSRTKKTIEEKIEDGAYSREYDAVELPGLPTVEHIRRAPAHLPKVAADLWRATCKSLSQSGALIELAYPQIENYCLQYYIFKQHEAKLYGLEYPGVEQFSNGNRGANKDHDAVNTARKQMANFETAWGLTPAAGLAITPPDDDEPDFIL